jgi:hypothetical protein
MNNADQNQTKDTPAAGEAADTNQIQGRSVFVVETTAQGVGVQTAFLASDNRVMFLPAVFPDVDYAYAQIDELRRLVGHHFAQAAQVGAQVIAAQMAGQQSASAAPAPAEPVVLN